MEGSNTGINTRPSIKVFYDCDHLSLTDFADVLLGIEEEGIPYDLQAEHCADVLELAHNASLKGHGRARERKTRGHGAGLVRRADGITARLYAGYEVRLGLANDPATTTIARSLQAATSIIDSANR